MEEKKPKNVREIFEELRIPIWFAEPIDNPNAMIHHLKKKK